MHASDLDCGNVGLQHLEQEYSTTQTNLVLCLRYAAVFLQLKHS